MPAPRHTRAVLNSIYEDYAEATVPLAIDWGTDSGHSSAAEYSEEDELPPPPRISDPDIQPTVVGRKGFGSERVRSTSPLVVTKPLPKTPPKNRHKRTASTDSDDGLWFASPVDVPTPPASMGSPRSSSPKRPTHKVQRQYDSGSSGFDLPTPPQSVSKFSIFRDDSKDRTLSSR